MILKLMTEMKRKQKKMSAMRKKMMLRTKSMSPKMLMRKTTRKMSWKSRRMSLVLGSQQLRQGISHRSRSFLIS